MRPRIRELEPPLLDQNIGRGIVRDLPKGRYPGRHDRVDVVFKSWWEFSPSLNHLIILINNWESILFC